MPKPWRPDMLLAAVLLCIPVACSEEAAAPVATETARPELGLMGTIPIYWGEAGDFGDMLAGDATQHWARARLESQYSLHPLDVLDRDSLSPLQYLLLAQPRPLSPTENVALDEWVRGGGQLLLFADPMLTGESRFVIGDRRRPQDVILLSPILRHWGLELQFDDEQPAGYSEVDAAGETIPVNLTGSFEVTEGEGECQVQADGVLARCSIGEGSVTVLADAAILDLYEPHPAAAPALGWLVGESFAQGGK